MKRRLEQFYAQFGDRGIMFILYAFSLVINSLLCWNMELPAVYPDEISVAGTTSFYSGKGAWELAVQNGSGGYVQALFYVPLFWALNNPFVLYKAMLIVNALLISFVPMITYHLASKLGVPRVRQKLMIAVCCGMYISYIANSKFIWNETITALMFWLLVLCFFSAWDKVGKGSRFSGSVLLGFTSAVAYASDERMIAPVIALTVVIVTAQLAVREKIVNLPVYIAALILSFVGEHFLRGTLSTALGVSAQLFPDSVNGSNDFFGLMFSNLYSYMTSTLGMGALALALAVILLLNLIKEGTRKRVETPESNTRVYEPMKHRYSLRFTLFSLFVLLSVIFTAVYSALFDKIGEADEFVRSAGNLAAPALFLVFVFIFLYGIDLPKIILGIGIYTYACVCFGVLGYPMMKRAETADTLSFYGLMSVDQSALSDGTPSGMSYVIMSSCVFSMFALMFVFAACSRRHRGMLISLSSFLVIITATIYPGMYRLELDGIQNSAATESFREVSSLLYNDSQSPPVIVYETDPKLAATIQFLNPEVTVRIMSSKDKVPESCLVVAESGVQILLEGGSYDNVGKTDKYTVYAFGESARDFIRYSSSKS